MLSIFPSVSLLSYLIFSTVLKKKERSILKSLEESLTTSEINPSVSSGLKLEIIKTFKINSHYTQVSQLSFSSILSEEFSQS